MALSCELFSWTYSKCIVSFLFLPPFLALPLLLSCFPSFPLSPLSPPLSLYISVSSHFGHALIWTGNTLYLAGKIVYHCLKNTLPGPSPPPSSQRVVGGLEVLSLMEKVETDDQDRPVVSDLSHRHAHTHTHMHTRAHTHTHTHTHHTHRGRERLKGRERGKNGGREGGRNMYSYTFLNVRCVFVCVCVV